MTEARYIVTAFDDPTARCECAEKHVPKPLELHKHHVWPLGEGGPDVKSNLLTLCPTTHANVHRLWRLYEKYEKQGKLPTWLELRHYSDYARRVVSRGREQKRQHEAAVRQSIPRNEMEMGSLERLEG